MAWTVDKKRTFKREVKDPETGEVAEVELRKFTEGDSQDREGLSISMRLERRRKGRKARKASKGSETDVDYTPGRVRLFEIERGLVSWSIPLPLNIMSIKSLDPAVAKQIHDHIVDLNPFFFDEEEELEDELDEDEEAGEVHSLSAVPASEEDDYPTSEEYGEYEGPKENAGTN